MYHKVYIDIFKARVAIFFLINTIYYRDRPYIIRLSEQNLIKRTAGLTPKDFLIEDFFIHPNYLPASKYNDIALIKFKGKVVLSNNLRPACLWQNHTINYTEAIATGWGNTDFAGVKSDELLKVKLALIDTDVCRPYFESTKNLENGIINSQICAGSLTENKDTCQVIIIYKKKSNKF